MRWRLMWVALVAVLPRITLAAVGIDIARVTVQAGEETTLEVTLAASGNDVVATENLIHFPDGVSIVSCSANDAIGKDATLFTYLPQGCQPSVDCTAVRALVLSLLDQSVIPDGSVLYTCTVAVASDSAPGNETIECTDALASTAAAVALETACPATTLQIVTPAVVSIMVGTATAAPGQQATVDVSIEHQAAPVATENDLFFPPQAHVRSCSENPAIDKDSSRILLLPQGCTPGVDCTEVRALVFSLDNPSVIPSGSVLYSCIVEVDSETSVGTILPITCANAAASTADAESLQADCQDGAIVVRTPCIGDCNGDRLVPISELLTGINVLLDRIPLDTCAAFDRNGDGGVTVDEIVAAVADALRGCSQ